MICVSVFFYIGHRRRVTTGLACFKDIWSSNTCSTFHVIFDTLHCNLSCVYPFPIDSAFTTDFVLCLLDLTLTFPTIYYTIYTVYYIYQVPGSRCNFGTLGKKFLEVMFTLLTAKYSFF